VIVLLPLTFRRACTQVYTILCRTTFQSFAGKDIDDGESYHQNDFTVDCNSDGYQVYAVFAVIFIAIYPIGIVAFFVALLYLNRKVLGGQAGGRATSKRSTSWQTATAARLSGTKSSTSSGAEQSSRS
jgi:hypothetical protein